MSGHARTCLANLSFWGRVKAGKKKAGNYLIYAEYSVRHSLLLGKTS